MATPEFQPLISIIMPVYNAGTYVEMALQSVLSQTWRNWELIVVNDGSTDDSEEKILKFDDVRMTYLKQENRGVSAARNRGLDIIKGDYFCFLDADDLMLPSSLESRMHVFLNNHDLAFVGGAQEQWDHLLKNLLCLQKPNYWGVPLKGLMTLDSRCFINCGTWLIKRDNTTEYRFPVGWTHAEDLAFFFTIAEQGILGYTEEVVQIYRRSEHTAMTNLKGLEDGYQKYYQMIRNSKKASITVLWYLRWKIVKIMVLSYFKVGQVNNAIKVLGKLL